MRNLQKPLLCRGWKMVWRVIAMGAICAAAFDGFAQPANDNFADAEDVSSLNSGLWGSVTNDLSVATAELGEPGHAGFPARGTVWYRWTAPKDGEVQVDTLASSLGSETVLAVYTGDNLGRLRQIAANDDVFPYQQENETSDVIPGLGAPISFQYVQPFNGPSALRFNAKAGTSYYFVVGTKFAGGPVTLAWAYHPAGVFRFATEDVDFSTRAPLFRCAETESVGDGDASTFQTYYEFGVPGVLITVTRVAGTSGRMLVDYFTEDLTAPIGDNAIAVGGLSFLSDYLPVSGTLVFDDFEMTKRVVIPINYQFGPQTNRDFAIVLTNARPDSLESAEVSQPLIDGAYGRAIVRILDTDTDPWWPANFSPDPDDTNDPPVMPPIFAPTNSVFNFGRAAFRTLEDVNGYWTQVEIPVFRSGGDNEAVTLGYRVNNFLGAGEGGPPNNAEGDNLFFPLQPGSDYATPHPTDDEGGGIGIHGTNADFTMTGNYGFPGGGTISWGQDDFQTKYITFTVTNDSLTEFNEDFYITLYRTIGQDDSPFWSTTALVGMVNETKVTILFDDQDPPAGSVDQYHNPDYGARMVPPVITTPPNQAAPGADSTVYGLVVQPDDRTVIVGDFQSYNSTVRNRIARLNVDGSLDNSFNPGSGANNSITALARTQSGQFVVGGGFTSYNGTPRTGVARLNSNGSLDNSFTPGVGPDGWVWAVAVQPDGKVIIAGEFTSVAGAPRAHIARLNTNGVLDVTFDPGPNGPDGNIWALALQPDGKILIGGEFDVIGGETRGGIARLNSDGSLDTAFNPGAGTDGAVFAVALQSDNRVLVGGAFTAIDFNPRNNLTRLNSDGSLDLTFDPASLGADAPVYSIVPAGPMLYVGGSFLKFNGTHRRGMVRLFLDGTVDTSFLDTAYNHFAGLYRARFSDPAGIVYAAGVQTDGKIMIGGSFSKVGGGQNDDEVVRADIFDPNTWSEPKSRDGVRTRLNVARLLGGATPGPGNLSFTATDHTVSENQSSLSVSLTRTNGTLGFASANFEIESGLAQSGVDYIYNAVPPIYLSSWAGELYWTPDTPNSATRMHSDGLFGDNFVPTDLYGHQWFAYTPGILVVTVINDFLNQGNRDTTFRLVNPSSADVFYLGGENIPLGAALGFSQAPLTILDDDNQRGVLGFSSVNFVVNENVTNAVVTVVRTNGSFGTVSCRYFTTAGGSATAGSDYQSIIASPANTLTFGNGQTSKTFTIPITDDSSVEADETIFIRLSTPGGGAMLGLSNSVVTIVDNDTPGGKLNFTSATYATNENSGAALVTVVRNGSSAGTLTVQVAATNGTATAGADFTAITNLLVWTNGDVSAKTVLIPLVDDVAIEPDETVNLRLLNPTLNSLPNPQTLGVATNATLTILNDDFAGRVLFSTAIYNANENGGPAIITVVRQGGEAESVSVNFAAFNGTAVGGFDFTPTNGTLSFGPGELAKSFTVPIIPNNAPDSPRFISLALSNASPAGSLGAPSASIINIIDDESFNEPPGGPDTVFVPFGMDDSVFALSLQSDGSILAGGDFTTVNQVPRSRLVRMNPAGGAVDQTFTPAANGTVRALSPQTDGRILIGGSFTVVNNVVRNHIARINANGSLDTSFDVGPGTDNPVFALAESFVGGQRKILLGGAFTVFNGVARNGIARLNNDGSLDPAFGEGLLGANGVVYAIAAYPTNTLNAGKVLIAGEFTTVNGIGRNRIARLNSDGSLDLSFDPGSGANDTIRALALQTDERILIGGAFTNFNGVTMNRIARLNGNGSLDATFTPGAGADDTVNVIAVQGDTRIVLGGQFKRCNGVTRNHLTRLNNDGTVDPTINFGTGANNFVAAIVTQPDGKIIIGGGFTEYDGVPRQRIARIYGGSIAGSGTFEFVSATFSVNENATNATITVRRRGGTAGQPPINDISVKAVAVDQTATNGIHYLGGTNTLAFPPGEVLLSFEIPVIDNFEVNPDRTVDLLLSDIAPPGSAALGNQPTATLTIVNDDSAISFGAANYTRNEGSLDGQASIQIIRFGSVLGTATVDFTTTTNGTATLGVDYLAATNSVVFVPGETVKFVAVPILNDQLSEGDETVTMQLTNAGGALLLAPSLATLTIVDDDFAPGRISFAAPVFFAGENGGSAAVTLIRTNGRSGVVSAQFFTTGISATPNLDYTPQSGSVVFGDGETNKTILIPLADDSVVEGPEVFNISITNFTGGATLLGLDTVPVTIVDNDVGITFASPVFLVGESGPSVSVTVLRINGSNGVATVNYTTTNVTASAGIDYIATGGTLTFANGETIKSFTVPVLEDSIVEGDETIAVVLSSPSAGAVLLNGTANISILDNDTGLGFGPASYVVNENGTNIMLTVVRTNANTIDPVTVTYGTTNGTATAGGDYVGTAGVLTFTNGEAFKFITVPILEDTQVEGDESFTVALSNPTGGAQFTGPTVATISVVDNDAGLAFTSDEYSILEGGVQQTITVIRSGITNSTVAVSFATSDGTATNNQDYIAASGLLVFTNGEVSKTFSIPVIDDTLEEGVETVLIKLSSPTGQVALLNPNSATLTIVDNDGSLVLPAGSRLTSESISVNGAVDVGETVTAVFAIRNVSGFDTENLTATLLVTNGITAPSGPQNYGALTTGGASVSRPFTFTATGTNGSIIAATFQLQDGINNFGRVTFNFLLGSSSAVFSNLAPVVITDSTNNTPAPATPYPSVINVSGLGGSVSKVVVVLTNIAHTNPDDVDLLLANPAAKSVVLMSDAGGGSQITNVTLTLDDAAVGFLPDSTQITSGTYKPSNYLLGDSFPQPAPPPPAGNPPQYPTALSTFNGASPNGAWSLYAVDDAALDSGRIVRGWYLFLTTSGVVPAAADLSVTMSDEPDPGIVGSNLVYTILVTNHGPWSATGVVLTNELPSNAAYVSSSASVGTLGTNGTGQLIWTIGSLPVDASASATITVRPAVTGTVGSTSMATALQADPNPENSIASVSSTIASPTADLAVGLVDSPSPVYFGGNLTYTLFVTNHGPATATAVAVTNTLPPGMTLLSVTPSGYTVVGNVITFTNLGDFGNDAVFTATIVVHPNIVGEFTNTATAASVVVDPLKGNNTAAVKSLVEYPPLSAVLQGNNLVISWPVDATNFSLESATNLTPPVVWTPVTTPPAVIVDGQRYVTNVIGGGDRFFRLRATLP